MALGGRGDSDADRVRKDALLGHRSPPSPAASVLRDETKLGSERLDSVRLDWVCFGDSGTAGWLMTDAHSRRFKWQRRDDLCVRAAHRPQLKSPSLSHLNTEEHSVLCCVEQVFLNNL